MPSIINSDDGVVSGTSGLKTTGGNDGLLNIQTNGSTAMSVNASQQVTFNNGANLPNTFGFKNRLINGSFAVDQRNAGASQTITGGASTLAFNCDRWQVRSAGANATVQQIVTNNTYRMRFTGAASVSAVAAQQSIEALNCVDLAGGTATLSLVASSTSLTSLTLEAYYANTTNTFGTWGSPAVTSIGSQAVNISTTEATVSWTFSVPSAATTGIQIRITGGSLGATQTLTIGNVQLERGSAATSFDFRSYGHELLLCQRYCEVFRGNGANCIVGIGYGNTSTNLRIPLQFTVVKRTSPTTTLSSAGTFAVQSNGVNNVCTAMTIYANSPTTTWIGADIGTANILVNGAAGFLLYDVGGTPLITASAEL